MEYKKLGSTDLNISQIGFGCWAIGGHGYGRVDDRESVKAVRKALDLGINFFDTADVYGLGHSEEILSKALGSKKHDVIIATKFGVNWDSNGKTFLDCSPKRIETALDASLGRLKLETIPLYQIHWYDNVTPLYEILSVLKRCQEIGKIRHIGLSNFPTSLLMEFVDVCNIESIQIPFNIINNEIDEDIIRYSEKQNVSIIVYNVLLRGLLTGKYHPDSIFNEGDTRAGDSNFSAKSMCEYRSIIDELSKIGKLCNKKPSQVAIRWVLNNRYVTCAIVGAKTTIQVEENADVFEWNIPNDENIWRHGTQMCRCKT